MWLTEGFEHVSCLKGVVDILQTVVSLERSETSTPSKVNAFRTPVVGCVHPISVAK